MAAGLNRDSKIETNPEPQDVVDMLALSVLYMTQLDAILNNNTFHGRQGLRAIGPLVSAEALDTRYAIL